VANYIRNLIISDKGSREVLPQDEIISITLEVSSSFSTGEWSRGFHKQLQLSMTSGFCHGINQVFALLRCEH
jgi:hypothetical protein